MPPIPRPPVLSILGTPTGGELCVDGPKLLTTLTDYSWRLLLGDVIAGITVALVALPLSIAIAIASGATPKAGLATAIIGGFLISLSGGSKVQIGGPTGAFIVVVAGVLPGLASMGCCSRHCSPASYLS